MSGQVRNGAWLVKSGALKVCADASPCGCTTYYHCNACKDALSPPAFTVTLSGASYCLPLPAYQYPTGSPNGSFCMYRDTTDCVYFGYGPIITYHVDFPPPVTDWYFPTVIQAQFHDFGTYRQLCLQINTTGGIEYTIFNGCVILPEGEEFDCLNGIEVPSVIGVEGESETNECLGYSFKEGCSISERLWSLTGTVTLTPRDEPCPDAPPDNSSSSSGGISSSSASGSSSSSGGGSSSSADGSSSSSGPGGSSSSSGGGGGECPDCPGCYFLHVDSPFGSGFQTTYILFRQPDCSYKSAGDKAVLSNSGSTWRATITEGATSCLFLSDVSVTLCPPQFSGDWTTSDGSPCDEIELLFVDCSAVPGGGDGCEGCYVVTVSGGVFDGVSVIMEWNGSLWTGYTDVGGNIIQAGVSWDSGLWILSMLDSFFQSANWSLEGEPEDCPPSMMSNFDSTAIISPCFG